MMLQSSVGQSPQQARISGMERPLAKAIFGRRLGVITRQIEMAIGQDILPKLTELKQSVEVAEIERLAGLAARGEADALARVIADKRSEGQTSEHLCLTLLTLVARRLGEWWEDDRCTFVEVTLGMIILHQILRDLAPGMAMSRIGGRGRSALMMSGFGNQHRLGIAMVAEFFRAGGWAVDDESIDGMDALGARISGQWFGLVAISVGSSENLAAVTSTIAAIRKHSRNRDIAVMLGGPALLQQPGLAAAAGADMTAPDATEALRRAESLVALMSEAP